MSKIIKEKFWLLDPAELLKPYFVPDSSMTFSAKLNALTRLAIILGIVLVALKVKYSFVFIILSILFIILLYFSKMNTEQFDKLMNYKLPLNQQNTNFIDDRILANKNVNVPNIRSFCAKSDYPYNKDKMYDQDSYTVLGQQTGKFCGMLGDGNLTRKQIPYEELKKVSSLTKSDVGIDFFSPPIQIQEKSFIPPLIIPRLTDKDVWSPNDFDNTKKVNKENYTNLTETVGQDTFCPEAIKNVRMSSSIDPSKIDDYVDDFSYIGDYANIPTKIKVYSDVEPLPDGVVIPGRRQPINSNYAISAIPNWETSLEPKLYASAANHFEYPQPAEYGHQPYYNRYDPQLIRDDGPVGRQAEMPNRSPWSARVNGYEARGTIDFNEVFDPRFSGFGDPYRSYLDADKGNIAYYYGDLDAYKHPVFITRSKVDFIESREPMGKIRPLYLRDRNMCLNDAIDQAQNRWFQDTTEFREGLMASQMQKRNSELWQTRFAPIRLRP